MIRLSVPFPTILSVTETAAIPSSTRRLAGYVWLVVGALLGIGVCLVPMIFATMAVPAYVDSSADTINDFGVMAVLVWMAGVATLFVRRRYPWVVVAAGTILAVVIRLDAMLVLLGAAAVVVHRGRRQSLVATVVAGAVAVYAGLRDGLRPWLHASWASVMTPEVEMYDNPDRPLQVGVSLGLALLAGAVVLGIAWMVRGRKELRATEQARDAAEHRGDRLETTVTRQEERERLAREVHDALAHRLSLISLHSGALEEAARSSDPAVAEAAEFLRDNAHRSLEDLRDLISALRNPPDGARPIDDEPAAAPAIGMSAVPDLIDSARTSGVDIAATVMVSDADTAGDLLNRATYRIAQEALTNAVKHAPGEPVSVELRASPASGVRLRVVNRMSTADAGLPGSGSGLIGMQERAGVVGGTVKAGPDGRGAFVVEAVLPWSPRG